MIDDQYMYEWMLTCPHILGMRSQAHSQEFPSYFHVRFAVISQMLSRRIEILFGFNHLPDATMPDSTVAN